MNDKIRCTAGDAAAGLPMAGETRIADNGG